VGEGGNSCKGSLGPGIHIEKRGKKLVPFRGEKGNKKPKTINETFIGDVIPTTKRGGEPGNIIRKCHEGGVETGWDA